MRRQAEVDKSARGDGTDRCAEDGAGQRETGGFQQRDILRTLFARNELTHSILEMAQAACDAAGHVAIGAVLARLGLA